MPNPNFELFIGGAFFLGKEYFLTRASPKKSSFPTKKTPFLSLNLRKKSKFTAKPAPR